METIHITRTTEHGEVYGHETSHCDPQGCAGDELFWKDLEGADLEVGEVYALEDGIAYSLDED